MKRILFDPTDVKVNDSTLRTSDWKYFYGDVEDEDPPNIHDPLGKEMVISTFVGANHRGNKSHKDPIFAQ